MQLYKYSLKKVQNITDNHNDNNNNKNDNNNYENIHNDSNPGFNKIQFKRYVEVVAKIRYTAPSLQSYSLGVSIQIILS